MEQKRLDKRNLLVIGVIILLIAVVAIVAATQKRELNPTLGTLAADSTATPVATEAATSAPEATGMPESTASADASPEATREPAQAYLVVTVAGAMYEPIPLYGEGRYTITRGEMVNVIEVTADSVKMHESSCDNQDCVLQGTVTLDNKDERVLQHMILCLPNEVVLELYTADEVTERLLSMVGYTGEETNE